YSWRRRRAVRLQASCRAQSSRCAPPSRLAARARPANDRDHSRAMAVGGWRGGTPAGPQIAGPRPLNLTLGSAPGRYWPFVGGWSKVTAVRPRVAGSGRVVGWIVVRHHVEVKLRLAAVRHRPEQCIGILGLDVLVDCDDPFAGKTVQGGCAVEGTPDFRLGHAARALNRDDGVETGQRLVHRDALDAGNAEDRAQMMEINGLHRHPADPARFAWGDLAHQRTEDRMGSARDRGNLHYSIIFLQVDDAV